MTGAAVPVWGGGHSFTREFTPQFQADKRRAESPSCVCLLSSTFSPKRFLDQRGIFWDGIFWPLAKAGDHDQAGPGRGRGRPVSVRRRK